MMKTSNFYLSLLLTVFLTSIVFGQDWKKRYEPSNVFIEYKGQFSPIEKLKGIGEILYVLDQGPTKIYFGTEGINYDFLEAEKKPKAEREQIMAELENSGSKEEYKKKERLYGKFMYKFDRVKMNWLGANPNTTIEATEAQDDFHGYAIADASGEINSVEGVKGFKKITYKNLYPGIDVEYVIHPESGVKYALHVAPNADPSVVKMVYDRNISLKDGAIHIETDFGDILDHAPLTFYDKNKNEVIHSEFSIKNNSISFHLGDYDNSQAIIIDPWTQTPTFNTDWNCIWEVEYDGNGNAYIIGGIMPLKLQKYDPNGILQWTYNTPYDTSNGWLGGLGTDDVGNSYVTRGSVAGIIKVNTTGNLEWTSAGSGTLGDSDEYWTVQFSCDESKVIIGGTRLSPFTFSLRPAIFDIDVNNGNVLNTIIVHEGAFLPAREVRALSSAPNSRFYYVSHDTIGFLSDNFDLCDGDVEANGSKINHGFTLSYKHENFRVNNSGIQALKATDDFLFVNKGDELEQRDLQTLQIINSVAIPNGQMNNTPIIGGNSVSNSGIDVDECGNIYVGSRDRVVKFNPNLTVADEYTTSFRVYDVQVGPNGRLVAAGSTGTSNDNARDGYVQQFNISTCAPLAIDECCDANFCAPPELCESDAPYTIEVSQAGGTFSGPGIDPSTGTFDPSAAGAGTHEITYTLPCGEETRTFVVSPCAELSVCEDENGDLVVSGGNGPYDWQTEETVTTPINTQAECESCGGIWILAVCTEDECTSDQWVTYATGTTVAPPATFPLQVIDGDGSSVIINSSSDIDLCSDDPVDPGCPTITVSIDAQTDISCFGAGDGTATVSAAGGNPAYTYTWMPGNLTGATQTNLTPGVYTVTATDLDDCTGDVQVTIAEPDAIELSSTSTPPTCGVEDGEVTVSVDAGGTGAFTYDWQPGGAQTATVSNLGAGSYTVTVTDGNGCSEELIVNLSSNDAPEITIDETNPASCANTADGSATVSVTGGNPAYTYSWSPSGGNGLTATGLTPGNYSFTVTDSDNCSASITVTIGGPTPIAINGNTTGTSCAGGDGAINVTASGGNGGYTYAWTPNVGTTANVTNLNNGQYTVTVTDSEGCSNNETFVVSQADTVIVEAVPNSVIITNGDNVTLSANTVPPSSTNTYSWEPSTGLSCTDCPNPVASPTETTTYTVTVTTDEGCVGEADVLVTVEEPCGEPYLPTIFSPNGDGTNDFLCVLSNCVLSLEMSIYNRWGEQVFTTGSTEDCWDGTYKGKDVNSGVFVYKLRIRLTNGEERLESGNITLVR